MCAFQLRCDVPGYARVVVGIYVDMELKCRETESNVGHTYILSVCTLNRF